ncbi:MAG: transporter [Nocardia sp.]|uniref:DHA2 family efflux MFS transporter permease subunit n=1 Tax=Nocardia sp. TaxID=1821 RepID=UPI00262AC409|nr:DHA2 family efflux MFS transporter permease subunit [Nocardia sp.]MCU1644942.1 transporter [Nocardia sp.]
MRDEKSPWPPLYALVVGFFMITLDMTIVAVANPAILVDLHTDVNGVIWVTSAYLLSYVAPLLVAGRMGDRFGPKNLYLAGLVLFTLASLACGLATGINELIVARSFQGLGAAIMTPQTMTVITRTFPPDKRGPALGLWGGVAGLASLVGPVLGGFLVDSLGWQWIFLVNVPIGLIGLVLAVVLVPSFPPGDKRNDVAGVVLSSAGVLLLVYGIQQGNSYDWSARTWSIIVCGLVVLVAFVLHQARDGNRAPLMPLRLFRDRNFVLSNLGISMMGASITWLTLSGFLYLQTVREMSAIKSGLVFAPLAVITGMLAPLMGKLADRLHPRVVPGLGFALYAIAMLWFAAVLRPDTSVPMLLIPLTVMGAANSCIWAPLPAIANRNLPLELAGAGSGVYNTIRQTGAVLGSAATSALITTLMVSKGFHAFAATGSGTGTQLSAQARDGLCSAIRDSAWLPVLLLAVGALASAMLERQASAADGETSSVDTGLEAGATA